MMRGSRLRVAMRIGDGARPGKRWAVYPCVEWLEKHGLVVRSHGPSSDRWWYEHHPTLPGGPLALTAKCVADIKKAIAEHEAKGTGWVVSGRQPERQINNRVLFYKVGRSWGETATRVFHE